MNALEIAGIEFIDENGGGPGCGFDSGTKKRVRQQATGDIGIQRPERGTRGAATKAARKVRIVRFRIRESRYGPAPSTLVKAVAFRAGSGS
jgi:hypothetical protein